MHGIRRGRPGRPGDAVIVTGSNTGLGLATVRRLAAGGFRVFATVRDPSQAGELERTAQTPGAQVAILRLDLTERATIDQAVQTVVEAAGGVFGLVNNAGIGLRGAVEDCSEQEIRRVFETNVLGTVAVTRAVVPHMRRCGFGRIVTITSIGGRVPGYGVTIYCASKFAQEGLGEGLAVELAPFGIQSVIVEPGMIKTERWSTHRGTARGALDPASPYRRLFWSSEAIADRIVQRSPTRPEEVAAAVSEALTSPDPKMRYIVGRGARLVVFLRRHLPPTVFERLYYGGQLRRLGRAGELGVPAPAAGDPQVGETHAHVEHEAGP
jgi:NAD(P)-dependent dehydrogenase (short-subunit alcohol dehydrogenase family)